MNIFGYLTYVGFMGFMVLFFGKITDFGLECLGKELPFSLWSMGLTAWIIKLSLWALYMKLTEGIYRSAYAYYKIPFQVPSRKVRITSDVTLISLMGFHYVMTGWVIEHFHLHLFSMTAFVMAISLLMGITMQNWFRSLNQTTVIFIRHDIN